MTRSKWLLAAVLVAALGASGCTPQALVALFRPDPQTDAKFKLASGALLVLVDEPLDAPPDPDARYQVIRSIHAKLRQEKVNLQAIPQDRLTRLQKTQPQCMQWPEDKLGESLGAVQVLHVQLDEVSTNDQSMDMRPHSRAQANVRVIDVETGDQLWPKERAGYPVVFELKPRDMHELEITPDLRKRLAQGLGEQVVKLFYKHKLSDYEASKQASEEKPD